MGAFVFMAYTGGALAYCKKGRPFLSCLLWPMDFGASMAFFALEDKERQNADR